MAIGAAPTEADTLSDVIAIDDAVTTLSVNNPRRKERRGRPPLFLTPKLRINNYQATRAQSIKVRKPDHKYITISSIKKPSSSRELGESNYPQ